MKKKRNRSRPATKLPVTHAKRQLACRQDPSESVSWRRRLQAKRRPSLTAGSHRRVCAAPNRPTNRPPVPARPCGRDCSLT